MNGGRRSASVLLTCKRVDFDDPSDPVGEFDSEVGNSGKGFVEEGARRIPLSELPDGLRDELARHMSQETDPGFPGEDRPPEYRLLARALFDPEHPEAMTFVGFELRKQVTRESVEATVRRATEGTLVRRCCRL